MTVELKADSLNMYLPCGITYGSESSVWHKRDI